MAFVWTKVHWRRSIIPSQRGKPPQVLKPWSDGMILLETRRMRPLRWQPWATTVSSGHSSKMCGIRTPASNRKPNIGIETPQAYNEQDDASRSTAKRNEFTPKHRRPHQWLTHKRPRHSSSPRTASNGIRNIWKAARYTKSRDNYIYILILVVGQA